jgi:ribonuclease III
MPLLANQIFGHTFHDLSLLRQALTHPSYLNEARDSAGEDYQRLEFLGDAVLGLLLADLLFQRFPRVAEGDLSRMRSSLVDQPRLAELAVAAEIAPLILMGKGAEQEGGRTAPSILSDVFEALIGAIYRDAGFNTVQVVVENIYAPLLTELAGNKSVFNDAKSELQEQLAAQKKPNPVYTVIGAEGPDHDRHFRVAVMVNGCTVAEGEGRSKKAAQQAAARAALLQLQS